MKYIRTEIPDVILCKPMVFNDDRGYFVESFKKESLENFIGKELSFCQDNESKSTKGVLRGLHYQSPPYTQTKLVRVICGSVLDIAVDIRKESKTFGRYVSVELNEENKFQLLIPRGFAHGYVVLSQEAIFSYKVDNYYHKESERGIAFNDKTLNINWQIDSKEITVSDKDKNQPNFIEADMFNEY